MTERVMILEFELLREIPLPCTWVIQQSWMNALLPEMEMAFLAPDAAVETEIPLISILFALTVIVSLVVSVGIILKISPGPRTFTLFFVMEISSVVVVTPDGSEARQKMMSLAPFVTRVWACAKVFTAVIGVRPVFASEPETGSQ